MKKVINIIYLAIICLFILPFCKTRQSSDNYESTNLITIKTIGLAHLEEFNLEQAEQEFLRFISLSPDEKFGYANLGLTYLRMGKYPEAKKALQTAIEIDSLDPDIRLILALVYQMNDEPMQAINELKDALTFAPDHIRILYQLTELYLMFPDEESRNQRENYMIRLCHNAPGNLVPLLNIIDTYIRKGETEKAIEQMEVVLSIFPEFPKEANDPYLSTLSYLRKKDNKNAIIHYTVFHNYLKVTSVYQAGMVDLKGPGGALIGFPLITFDTQVSARRFSSGSLLEVIKFTDVTASAGLDILPTFNEYDNPEYRDCTSVTTADYDGDGDTDIYVGSYDPVTSSYKHYLFNNEMGRFKDIAYEAGLKHSGKEFSALFADFDNDGFLDLYILREGGDLLYRNTDRGLFQNFTSTAKIGSRTGGKKALFFDADHDGDLDLFEITPKVNLYFRNNGNGTFQEQPPSTGLPSAGLTSRDAAFGDFNEDGVIDLVVVNEAGSNILYSNQRQGVFRDATERSGLTGEEGSAGVCAADCNNNGFLDLLILSVKGENSSLFLNMKDGTFERDTKAEELFRILRQVRIHDAAFFDFDNDGYIDLLIAGEHSDNGERGLFLLHNSGDAIFTDVSHLLPPEIKSGRQIALFDYNDDGDIDILIAGFDGRVSLLRNDGGNNNHFIKLRLVGLRAGSAKNNHFGIGAKVEIRADDLYRALIVTDPDIHFGIGNRAGADVIRITWTNGVPQNIFMPGSNKAFIEGQILKGSCPFLYTWNGKEYTFVKDIMWRSALGMPLGIMGSTTTYGFADASDDYIKIPGESLKPLNGKYSIRFTSELWETMYTDEIELVVIDHPDSVDIFVPEQFSPPPFPGLQIYQVNNKISPLSATDINGNDVLSYIKEKDDRYLSGFRPGKYQGLTELTELILDPGRIDNSDPQYLFLTGWIFPTDASINYAISQSDTIVVLPPVIQVLNKKGEWETVIDDLGFPMGKDKTVIANLSGKFLSSDCRIKIVTNMEIYWDHIFFSGSLSDSPFIKTVLKPVYADLRYRGFSRSYRKGGRYGPHWFDYTQLDKDNRWRDLTGNYTRYGDVLPLLQDSDNKYIISNAGDEVSIGFNAEDLPELRKGWSRDFLIRSVGWVKDGDLNTAFGSTVLPLPFHGMNSYPPGEKDIYPSDPDLARYNNEYNTRTVTSEGYLNAIKEIDK